MFGVELLQLRGTFTDASLEVSRLSELQKSRLGSQWMHSQSEGAEQTSATREDWTSCAMSTPRVRQAESNTTTCRSFSRISWLCELRALDLGPTECLLQAWIVKCS